jgi:hypothetical protein
VSGCCGKHIVALGVDLIECRDRSLPNIQLSFVEECFVILIKKTVGVSKATRFVVVV